MPQCAHCGTEQEAGTRCRKCGGRVGTEVQSGGTAPSQIRLKGEGDPTPQKASMCPYCGKPVKGARCLQCGKIVATAPRDPDLNGRSSTPRSPSGESTLPTPRPEIRKWVILGALIVLLGMATEAVFFFSPTTAQGLMASIGLAEPVATPADEVRATSLSVGQCFKHGMGDADWDTVIPVPCARTHDGEVFAALTLPLDADDALDDGLTACLTEGGSDSDLSVFAPADEDWESAERTVLCFFDFPGGQKG